MPAINIPGYGTGLDTQGIISQLVSIEQQPINQLAQKQSDLDAAKATISSIASKFSTLQAAANALSDPVGFASYSASSSDTGVVATVNGSASPGAYDVNVTKVATEQRTNSDTQTSKTDSLNLSGTLSIQAGSANPVSVTINASDSLQTIAAHISASGARVTASVLFDGQNYRLQVRGLDTGAANKVTFGGSQTLGLDNAANQAIGAQDAHDAVLSVDGRPITSASNQIVDAIPGVTLALTKATTGDATVTVATNSTALSQKLQNFVSAYNDAINTSHNAIGYGQIKPTNPNLGADPSVHTVLDQLSTLFSHTISGTSGGYTSIGSVGLNLQSDGTLQLDSTKLSAALASDPTSVSRLFVTDPITGSTGVMGNISTMIDNLVKNSTSPIQTRISSMTQQSSRYTDQMASMQKRIDQYATQLQNQFIAMNTEVEKYKSMLNAVSSISSSSGGSNSSNGSGGGSVL